MEDAAVAITSLSKGEVCVLKEGTNVKKKAVLTGSEVPKTKKKREWNNQKEERKKIKKKKYGRSKEESRRRQ
eukprot:11511532-Ditylum_brightwellii.AAC.1